MARLVYLHIGLPKTGTTFLQTAMWHNRSALEEQGIHYPGSKRMDHFHASVAIRDPSGTRSDSAWQRIVRELAEWDGTGLISHEFFSMATADQARAAVETLAPAEVHVVVTVRD